MIRGDQTIGKSNSKHCPSASTKRLIRSQSAWFRRKQSCFRRPFASEASPLSDLKDFLFVNKNNAQTVVQNCQIIMLNCCFVFCCPSGEPSQCNIFKNDFRSIMCQAIPIFMDVGPWIINDYYFLDLVRTKCGRRDMETRCARVGMCFSTYEL